MVTGFFHICSTDCRWTFVCPVGQPTITFTSFHTEWDWDFVNIYDGPTTEVQIARLHGATPPEPLTAVGLDRTMLVQFTSDSWDVVIAGVFEVDLNCLGDRSRFRCGLGFFFSFQLQRLLSLIHVQSLLAVQKLPI